jgi:Family of unknown function (DUF6893)
MKLLRRLLIGAFLVGAAAIVVQSLPDVARYLRMREM